MSVAEAPSAAPDGAPAGRLALVPPLARRGRRADIQGLRGLAVLLVVLFHAGLGFRGGFTGVDVFFVISGFVITGSLVAELEEGGRISLARFYARRVKRLLPALAAMLVTVAAVGTLLGPAATQHSGATTGMFASVFAANLYLLTLGTGYFDVATTLNPLLHTWTLAVEEQFYLVFPLLLLAGWRLRRRGRTTVAMLIALGSIASFAYSALLANGTIRVVGDPARLAFYSSLTRAWEFGAGAVVLLASPLLRRLVETPARVLGLAGLGLIAWAGLMAESSSSAAGAALLPVLGSCAVLASGTATSGGTARLLSTRVLGWVGDRSYGWYLWHWPLIVFAIALRPGAAWVGPAAAAAALVPAALSYRYLENPIRRNPRLQGRAAVRLAALCTLLPVAAFLGARAVESGLGTLPQMASWKQSMAYNASFERGCDNERPLGSRRLASCTWAVPHPRGRIVLFGDSNAGHFTEPVVRAGNRAGFDVTVATFASCPFVGIHTTRTACYPFATGTVQALARMRPSLVIVAARTDVYLDGFVAATRGTPASRARLWRTALTRTLGRLNGAGIPVVLVHPAPRLPDPPEGCAVVRILLGTCGRPVARSAVERELARAKAVENEVVGRSSRSWALDADDALCGATTCGPARRGIVLYRDDEHLSIGGALTLTPLFARAIAEHARPHR